MSTRTLQRTEEAARLLSKVLVCAECKQRSDELQFLGTVCRHAFCWSCINVFEKSRQGSCNLCNSLLELTKASPAHIVNGFNEKMDEFYSLLAKYRDIVEREGQPLPAATQKIAQTLLSIENEPRRNVDEFMLTQKMLNLPDKTPENSPRKMRSRTVSSSSSKDQQTDENAPPAELDKTGAPKVPKIIESATGGHYKPTPVTSKRQLPPGLPKGTSVPLLFQTQEMMGGGTQFPLVTPPPKVPSVPRCTRSFEFTKMPSRVFGEESARQVRQMPRIHETPSPELGITTPESKPKRDELPETLERKVQRKSLTYRKGKYDLIEAVLNNRLEELSRLVYEGHDVNESNDYQCTPLYFAAMHGRLDMCQLLVENGALINAQCGRYCDTPLHVAVKNQREDVVDYLLSKGASKTIENLHRKVPIEMADMMSPVRQLVERYAGRPMQPRIPARLPDVFIVYVHYNKKEGLKKLDNFKQLVKCEENLTAEVTHMIVLPTIENLDIFEADVVVIQAMLRGLTIVTGQWLIDCVAQEKLLRDTTNYEVQKIRFRDMEPAEGTCKQYRQDKQQLKPRLLQGCIFHVVSSRFKSYGSRNFISDILKLAGAEICQKEPKIDRLDPPPYYRQDLKTPYFVLYETDTKLSDRILGSAELHKVSPLWLFESLAKHKFVDPY